MEVATRFTLKSFAAFNMAHYLIATVVFLAIAHIVCDVNGVPMGKQVRWLFRPAVWLIFGATLGRIDLRHCKSCIAREARLNAMFNPTWFNYLWAKITSKLFGETTKP